MISTLVPLFNEHRLPFSCFLCSFLPYSSSFFFPLHFYFFLPLPAYLFLSLTLSDSPLLRFPLSPSGKKSKDRKDDVNGFRANTWLPSESRSVNDQRAAVTQRDNDRATRDAVLDGSRAPKLTGRNRYMKVSAISFILF